MQYLPWYCFDCSTHKGLNDFFSPKLFKLRRPFLYKSKYGTWRFFRKKIKFFSLRILRIFDSKHGSPENYSDFLISATTLLRFLVLLRGTHNSGFEKFLTPERFEPRLPILYTSKNGTWRFLKNQCFLSTGLPDIWLRTWLYRKLFWLFFSSSSRSRAMRSPCHNFSKILSNRNEISHTCSGVNVVVPNKYITYIIGISNATYT